MYRICRRTSLAATLLIVGSSAGCFWKTTPLHSAAAKNDVEAIRRELANGRPVDSRKRGNLTALEVAIIEGHFEAAKVLINAGASPDAPDSRGDTPLMYATRRDRGHFLDLLLARRPAINQQNSKGRTALHFASTRDQLESAKKLVRAGASKTVRDHNGKTPYDVAVSNDMRAVVAVPGSR